jgi:hypothetical protein
VGIDGVPYDGGDRNAVPSRGAAKGRDLIRSKAKHEAVNGVHQKSLRIWFQACQG